MDERYEEAADQAEHAELEQLHRGAAYRIGRIAFPVAAAIIAAVILYVLVRTAVAALIAAPIGALIGFGALFWWMGRRAGRAGRLRSADRRRGSRNGSAARGSRRCPGPSPSCASGW